ncbi:hypothetical protein Tco_0253341, partial [Tanacetum coccineum]
ALRFKRRLLDLAGLFKKGYRTTPLYPMLLELLYLPLEQLEVTLPDGKVLAKVKATRNRKASTAVGTSAKSSNRKRHARRSYRADSGFGEGSEVQAEAHGLSCVIQERIPNNTTLPDAPRIVIPTPIATRGYSSRRKGFGQS